jgi:hypothetical protein
MHDRRSSPDYPGAAGVGIHSGVMRWLEMVHARFTSNLAAVIGPVQQRLPLTVFSFFV